VSTLLPKITMLKIQVLGNNHGDYDFLWEQLASASFPVLECLTIKPVENHCDMMDLAFVLFTRRLLQALQSFRSSLKELRLLAACSPAPDLDVENLEWEVPGVVEGFEKLTRLRILTESMPTSLTTCWTLFSKIFFKSVED